VALGFVGGRLPVAKREAEETEGGEGEVSDERFVGMNDLGVPALAHWDLFRCDDSQPGDWAVDEVKDVTCPACIKRFDKMRGERRKVIGEMNG